MGAAAAIGAALQIASAAVAGKRQRKLKKRVLQGVGRTSTLGAKGIEEAEASKERKQSAELAKMGVWGLLGKEGTFGAGAGVGGGTGGGFLPSTLTNTESGGLFKEGSKKSQFAKSLIHGKNILGYQAEFDKNRTGILDPEAYASTVSHAPLFQMMSRQVSEANQLLAAEGPAWEMLKNSTLGQIFESSAIQSRESARKLRNNLAKGGSARRQAFAEAQDILGQERAHQFRAQETWRANQELFFNVRNYVQQVQEGARDFTENLPLVNRSYINSLDKSVELYQTALDSAIKGESASMDALINADGPGMWEGLLGYAAGVATTYAGAKMQADAIKAGRAGGDAATQQASGGNRTLVGDIQGVGQNILGGLGQTRDYLFGGVPSRGGEVPTGSTLGEDLYRG